MQPLKPLKYRPFSPGQVKPQGWLRQQLKIQAESLNGNLDRVWPDIRDSRWIGGKADGWERVPYWLDGFIPLAWLLEDADMQSRAAKYIDAILDRQEEDGWICPCTPEERGQYDVWVVFLICKVLVLYHDCTADARIENAVYRALKNLDRHIEQFTLFNWGLARWYECMIPLFWLYEKRPEEWMLTLAQKLQIQGMDYEKLFENWRYTEATPHGKWSYVTHVVNIAMSLKSGALLSRLQETDGGAFAKNALELLFRDHGMAAAHFTGDECLSGNSPVQGSECCSVVEAMYSYEQLLSIDGGTFWGDMLEKLTFNTLPATLTPDMWGHQYDQQTNQVQCAYLPKDNVVFGTNSEESHLFGLEPNFGCCTANFGQGFPKAALSALMQTEKGVAVTAILPVRAEFSHQGVPVRCEIRTEYPFRDRYTVVLSADKPVELEILLRIPGFAEAASVDGQKVLPGTYFQINRMIDVETAIHTELEFAAACTARPRDMACVWRGPLLYSLPIKEKWVMHEFERDGVERKFPYCDYEILPESPWNYAFASPCFTYEENLVGETPFSPETPPVQLRTMMVPICWELENGVCTVVPAGREPLGAPEEKILIPYGCTNLRLTEAPLLAESK